MWFVLMDMPNHKLIDIRLDDDEIIKTNNNWPKSQKVTSVAISESGYNETVNCFP